jgi:hypothetical protein
MTRMPLVENFIVVSWVVSWVFLASSPALKATGTGALADAARA